MGESLAAFLSAEPNWIVVTIVGAVLGATVNWWWMAGRYLLRWRKRHPLEGTWHEVHATFREGRPIIGRAEITISRGLTSTLRARAVEEEDHASGAHTVIDYTGEVVFEGHIVLLLRGRTHRETLVMRYFEAIPSNPAPMMGMWSSQDHDKNPAGGISAISRDRLADEEAHVLFRERAVSAKGVVKVKPPSHRLQPVRRSRAAE